MWYENPGWYALPMAILSLVISWRVWLTNRRISKSSIEQQLTQHAVEINEAFIRYDIKSPYAFHLNISQESQKLFNIKSVLLLHHINFLRTIFNNKDILGESTIVSYRTWANTIVRPWIEADEDLRRTWHLIKTSKDSYNKEFIEWLEELFPILHITNPN